MNASPGGEGEKPMFIPLRREWFEQFRRGEKSIEWRTYGGRWTIERAHAGRRVVLCLGYSGERLHGTIVGSQRVQPGAAPQVALDIYPHAFEFCAIHVVLDSDGMERN